MPGIPKPDPALGHKLGTPGFKASEIVGALIDRTATPTFVGPELPVLDPMPDVYLWVQTGIGDGADLTLWIEDGT